MKPDARKGRLISRPGRRKLKSSSGAPPHDLWLRPNLPLVVRYAAHLLRHDVPLSRSQHIRDRKSRSLERRWHGANQGERERPAQTYHHDLW